MLSVTDPALPEPCLEPFNLARYVLAAAGERPDHIALMIVRPDGADRWSYGRLAAAVRGVAAGFGAAKPGGAGLKPGDRILLRLGNGAGFPLAFLGAVAAGFVPVLTAAGLTPGEVARLCAVIRPALIVAGEGIALPAVPPCPVLVESDLRGFETLAPAPWAMGEAGRLAYIVQTSGSSGNPRAVAHAHRAVWSRRMMRAGWHGLGPGDRLLHAGALNWTYTLGVALFDPWAAGATALIPAEGVTVDQLPLLARRFDATVLAASPGVYRRILRQGTGLSLPRLRHGLAAGEKLPPALRQAWRDATGTDLHEAMGMSECSTFLSSSPARPAPEGATGFAQPGRRIAIVDASAAPVPLGRPGILAVHRSDPGLYLGAWAGETVLPLDADWFQTGDIAVMAEGGAVSILGRADDMLNAGGFRLSPEEIEGTMANFPGVTACAAVALPVKAETTVIALFYSGDAEEADLTAHAETHLARFKQPRLYLRRPTLPTTANGKLNRRQLREEWKADQ